MILETIELKHVGPFRNEVSLGPLKNGINVLAAPNERGKSTLLRAAARALFDRYTCKDDEIQSLQPAGSDLAPAIVVIFHSGGTRYRAEKRFLKNPESQFSEWRNGAWQLVAESDDADRRLQTLLQSNVPGRGATKAAHWGLLGYLWARQGDASEWPIWEGETGQFIQTRLAKVELDPLVNSLRDILWQEYAALFTEAGGRPRKNGELERLETELDQVSGELAEVQRKRRGAEDLQKRYSELGPELKRLEMEFQDREAGAKRLRGEANEVEAARSDLQLREGEFAAADEKLQAVNADVEKLRIHRKDLKEAKRALIQAVAAEKAAVAEKAAADERIAEAQTVFDSATARLASLNAARQRIADLQNLKQHETELAAAKQQAKKAQVQGAVQKALKAELGETPNVTPQKLSILHQVEQQIRESETKLEALGLAIELTPENDGAIKVHRDGAEERITLKARAKRAIHAVQAAELHLPGWGKLQVRSGATELRELQEKLDNDRADLRESLVEIGVVSLADAEQALSHRKDLQMDLRSAQEKLHGLLGDFGSLEKLEEHAAQLAVRVGALRQSLSPTGPERAKPSTDLDVQAEQLKGRVKGQQVIQADASTDLKNKRRIAGEKSEARGNAEREKINLSAKISSMEQQIESLLARYPQGIEKATKDAQGAFVRAEARRNEARSRLPAEYEKLPERSRRATQAAEEIRAAAERCGNEQHRLEGALEQAGAEGLHSKECRLAERKESLRTQVDALRARSWAARLVRDLIELRQQAATRSVLEPLEARLSAAFAEITSGADRRVFLDDELQIVGVGESREAAVGFPYLSQGAKEQLLLCLRLAVAAELSAQGRNLVILDDVLVNTDDLRQDRVLDVLRGAAEHSQILIATCHPERYRGVGELVEIRVG